MVGAFEPEGKPKAPGEVPTDGFAEFGEDWDHFAPVLARRARAAAGAARHRLQALPASPESFTPDANFHLGEFPEVPGLFVAAGLNSQGIIFGPGRRAGARRVDRRGPPDDGPRPRSTSRAWVAGRQPAPWLHEQDARDRSGACTRCTGPRMQPETARGLRRSPLLPQHRAAGAAVRRRPPAGIAPLGSSRAPGEPRDPLRLRSPVVVRARRARRSRATRERVALYDLTTYSKFMVQGPEARGRPATPRARRTSTSTIGRVVYTLLANERGGIEMDPTVTRLDDVGTSSSRRRCTSGARWALLRNGLPPDAVVTDVTCGYATLHIAGTAIARGASHA